MVGWGHVETDIQAARTKEGLVQARGRVGGGNDKHVLQFGCARTKGQSDQLC